MTDYLHAVELHGARWPDDYKGLSDELFKLGFKNSIGVISGRLRLPSRLYYALSIPFDLEHIANAVKAAPTALAAPIK